MRAVERARRGTSAGTDQVTFAHNVDGSISSRTSQKTGGDTASTLEYDYGKLRRLETVKTNPLGTGVGDTVQSVSYGHDALGRTTRVTTHSDGTPDTSSFTDAVNDVQYAFTDFGLLAEEHQEHEGAKDGNTLSISYVYDEADTDSDDVPDAGGRLLYVAYPNGRKVHYTYGTSTSLDNAISRVAAIQDDSSGSPGTTVASYYYAGAGRLVSENFDEHLGSLAYMPALSFTGTYTGFDRFGRVVDQHWYDYGASSTTDRFQYGYDAASNRTYRDNVHASAGARDWAYAYDGLNRLIDSDKGTLSGTPLVISSPVRSESWNLTQLGNWATFDIDDTDNNKDLNQTRLHNDANEVGTIALSQGGSGTNWVDPVHSARGNMTTMPKPAALDESLLCKYDAWNRLVEVKDGEVVIGAYEYDGLGHRTVSAIDSQAKGTPNGVDAYRHFFYNAGWQILETRVADSANAAADGEDPEVQYVWSLRYIDSPVLRDRDADSDSETGDLGLTDSGLEERLYYTTDANMNVTALLDTSGTVVERYEYTPYGEVTVYNSDWSSEVAWADSKKNHIRYCGYVWDWETELYTVRYRVYHAKLGRWGQRDPVGYSVEGANLGQYCISSPLDLVDPFGATSESTTEAPQRPTYPTGNANTTQGRRDLQKYYAELEVYEQYRYDNGTGTNDIDQWRRVLAVRVAKERYEDMLKDGCDATGDTTARFTRAGLSNSALDNPDESIKKGVPGIAHLIKWMPGSRSVGSKGVIVPAAKKVLQIEKDMAAFYHHLWVEFQCCACACEKYDKPWIVSRRSGPIMVQRWQCSEPKWYYVGDDSMRVMSTLPNGTSAGHLNSEIAAKAKAVCSDAGKKPYVEPKDVPKDPAPNVFGYERD